MKKIAILTSGGDSQGMNSAIIGCVKACNYFNIKPVLVRDGFWGLIHNDFFIFDLKLLEKFNRNGGTIIGTSRYPDFVDPNIQKLAAERLKKEEIDGLVVIGGNGSYMGGFGIGQFGIPVMTIPGTIDNDINNTDFTIGFDSTVNCILECLDRIRDTAESHNRCIIVEIMGRHCGDIALFSGIAGLADVLSTSEDTLTDKEIINQVTQLKKQDKRSVIVLVTEKLHNVQTLALLVEKASGYSTRSNIVGHLQRGGPPSARDRFFGITMGYEAINLLQKGVFNKSIACSGMDILAKPLENMKSIYYKQKYRKLYSSIYHKIMQNQNKEGKK